jgi:hypothetical protein
MKESGMLRQTSSRRVVRSVLEAAVAGALAITAGPARSQEPAPDETPPAEPASAASPGAVSRGAAASRVRYEARYHSFDEARALLAAWAAGAREVGSEPALDVRLSELARSRGGLPLLALELGRAGSVPLESRPTVLLLGAPDGVSLAGCEAVLAAVDGVLAEPASLPDDVTIVAIPWAAPDGLAAEAAGRSTGGRDAAPTDDDRDGAADEDGPDDLDGDGRVLWMLVPASGGAWARSASGRFVVPARAEDRRRYDLCREGADDDGDGRFNEDGPGGIVVDRNFPLGWRGAWEVPDGGELPLAAPEARAIAELALARKLVIAVALQGNHGSIVLPGGAPEAAVDADARAPYGSLALALRSALGRRAEALIGLAEVDGRARHGACIDWLHGALGVLAFELAAWGPEVERGAAAASSAAWSDGEPAEAERLSSADRAWERWLVEEKGGMGFVDWHPVTVPGARDVLVGGFEPFTVDNPPPGAALARALGGFDALARELAGALPRLEVEVVELEREGELVRLSARVANRGVLQSGLGAQSSCVLSLGLAGSARLLAGEPVVALGHLDGGESSASIGWLVQAPEKASLTLSAVDRFTLPVELELRP